MKELAGSLVKQRSFSN